MRERRPGEPQHQRFLRLCKAVVEEYENADTLEALRDSPFTPYLILYIQSAFNEYIELEPQYPGTDGRAAAIAISLRMVSRTARGKKTIVRPWPEKKEFACYTAFAFAYYAALEDGHPEDVAYDRGMTEAYKASRAGTRGDQSGTQRGRTKATLRALMAAQGRVEPVKSRERRERAGKR